MFAILVLADFASAKIKDSLTKTFFSHAYAYDKNLPPPPNPLPPGTAPTPTDPPTPATPEATKHDDAPASGSPASSSKDGGGAPPQTTPQRPKRTNSEETPEDKNKREDTAASEALRTKSISAAKKIREQKVLDSGAEHLAVDDDDPNL